MIAAIKKNAATWAGCDCPDQSRRDQLRDRSGERGSVEEKINHLVDLRGIGVVGGRKLMHEVFYRSFDNRRQVGSFVGLTNSARPRNSRAVLAAVKAWPGHNAACRHDPATASLDRSCARRLGETLGSGRRNGSRSNKETIQRKGMTLMDP